MRLSGQTARGGSRSIPGMGRKRRRAPLCGAIGLAVGLLFSVVVAGVQSGAEPRRVRVGTVTEIYPGVNAADARAAMQLWIDALLGKTGGRYVGVSVVFDSIEGPIQAVLKGELEVVNLSSVDFLRARPQVALEPMAVGMFADGEVKQEFLLVTRRNGGLQRLADLRGKRLLVNPLDWRVARLWLEVLLHQEGLLGSGVHLGEIVRAEGLSKQVLPVFFGQADACIVTARGLATLAELNPQLARQLAVLARSPAYLAYLTCLAPGLDEELHRDFMDMALNLHRDSAGRQMLTLFGLERTVSFKPEYLENLEELVAEYEQLVDRREER